MTQIPPTIVDCMSRFSFFRWGKSKSGTDDPSRDGDRFLADRVDRKKSASGKNADDPHLPEKKRARRRLVGSMTLVLAAVIVLPMIFESEPRPVSPDLLIDIPSKAKAVPESTDELPSVSADGTETQGRRRAVKRRRLRRRVRYYRRRPLPVNRLLSHRSGKTRRPWRQNRLSHRESWPDST